MISSKFSKKLRRIALEVVSRRVETATTGRAAQAQQEVTTVRHVHYARIRQIRPVLNTFKGVRDVVIRVQLTLDVRRVGKNSRPRLGRRGLEIDITTDILLTV